MPGRMGEFGLDCERTGERARAIPPSKAKELTR
jgi:hypothetical protein